MSKEVLLDVRHLTQQFHLTKKIKVKAVDDVSFQIHKGEIFGLVGESGSGKTTLGMALAGLIKASGDIFYKKINMKSLSGKGKKALKQKMQIVFQDPYQTATAKN